MGPRKQTWRIAPARQQGRGAIVAVLNLRCILLTRVVTCTGACVLGGARHVYYNVCAF